MAGGLAGIILLRLTKITFKNTIQIIQLCHLIDGYDDNTLPPLSEVEVEFISLHKLKQPHC